MSFIGGYVFELKQFPRNNDLFQIRDYFYYNSNTKDYGYKDTIIPKECIINNNEIPEETVVKELINKNIYVLRRVIDINKQNETWFFETNCLKEINK